MWEREKILLERFPFSNPSSAGLLQMTALAQYIYTNRRPLYNNCTLACTLREDQSPLGDCILVGGWRNNTIREGGWKCKNSIRPTI